MCMYMYMHSKMFSYILSLTLILPVFSDLAADRSALLRLQPAIGGQTLRWNTSVGSSPCSSWRGVTCNVKTGRVIELRLPGAGLRGQLPPDSIGNLTELRVLSLRNNALSGQLPSDLAACTLLEEIHLQGNTFSGEIPDSFFTLTNLLRVNFAGNNFSGDLSPEFNKLIELRTLYLENNNFSGSFSNWDSLTNLRNFNVSFNGLMTGSIPSILGTFSDQSFLGTFLCGKPLGSCSSTSSDGNKQLSNGAIAGIVVGSVVAFLSILFASFVLWRTYRSRKVLPQRSPIPRSPEQTLYSGVQTTAAEQYYNRTAIKNIGGGGDGLVFLGKDVEGFSLQELLGASAEAMGKGTVGSTYKAYFESGVQVIVKRLKNVCVSELDFRAKIEEVGSLLHQNLQPLKGYFYGREEKLLIYEPMPKGSLSTLLHGYGKNNRFLSLEMRARIAMGTASAIEYLHSISPKTTHGNIKASNVFVNDYYEARVSEMGLTQLVSGIANLNGYRAPEVTDTRSVSQKADVYSVGVVLLELVTGREPDRIVREEGIELPDWVQSVVEEKGTSEVIDQDLLSYDNDSEDQLVELLLLALSCTSHHPKARPSAPDLTRRLHKICGST